MRSVPVYRRRSSGSFWLGLLLILLAGGGGVAGLLLLLGVSLNPFAGPREDPFMVRIPINSRPIPAYQRVAREDLLNPATGGLMFQLVPPAATVGMSLVGIAADGSHVESQVEAVRNENGQVVFVAGDGQEVLQGQTLELGGALMQPTAIIGRVVKRDKRAGMGFRQDTFFPPGTPEGIAGATPPGMRAVTLDATKLTGVHALQAGDRIDLMASVPAEQAAASPQSGGRLPVAALVAAASGGLAATGTEPLLLAEGALVLKPVYVRNETTTSSSLTQGQRLQHVPKYEVAIAVSADDVIPLQSALDRSLSITCVAHSMQVAEGQEQAVPQTADSDQRQVPVTVRAILAYDVVSREAFVSPATRRVRLEPVSQQEIDRQGIITSLEEALGSVARHDIPSGRFLRRSDLLTGSVQRPGGVAEPAASHEQPVGLPQRDGASAQASRPAARLAVFQHQHADQHTGQSASAPMSVGDRPAVTRFIPAGYTAFAIPWNRLYGAEHLQIGDQLDLLVSYSLENDQELDETETRPDGTTIERKRHVVSTRHTLRTWDESLGQRADPWFVASDAVVVGPVGFPAPAAALRALGGALNQPSPAAGAAAGFSGPPLLIAVDNRDVEAVAAALASRDALFTLAMHPSEQDSAAAQGTRQIVIAAQDLEAFEQLSETVWIGNRRRPLIRTVRTDDTRFADALTVAEMRRFEFRVLRIAKRRGEFFVASDFLPDGSGPGVAAAAEPGETVLAVADHEIAGLDSLLAGDRVAILVRGVVTEPAGVIAHGVDLERAVSRVVVPQARIARASRGGQTILAVANADLTALQAAWAESQRASVSAGGERRRSHLLAVALPRGAADERPVAPRLTSHGDAAEPGELVEQDLAEQQLAETETPIPDFDPLSGLNLLEAVVGQRRELHAFPRRESAAIPGLSQAARP